MPGVTRAKDIKQLFNKNKKYVVELTGKELNVVFSALDIPLCPAEDFVDECIDVSQKLKTKFGIKG